TIQYNESVKLGERLLNQALYSFGTNPGTIESSQWEKLIKENGIKSKEALLADIALGKQLAAVIAKRLTTPANESTPNVGRNNSITIQGTEGMAVKFARCCYPIPGDGIVGLIKKDQGLIIHTQDCPAVIRVKDHKNMENQLDVVWGTDIDRTFPVSIRSEEHTSELQS